MFVSLFSIHGITVGPILDFLICWRFYTDNFIFSLHHNNSLEQPHTNNPIEPNNYQQIKMPNLGDVMPNFECDTTEGHIKFHDWLGGSWAILFSHPADYTPVCTTELSMAQKLAPDFEKRGVKMIALSVDTVDEHKGWICDIKNYTGGKIVYFNMRKIFAGYIRLDVYTLWFCGVHDPIKKYSFLFPYLSLLYSILCILSSMYSYFLDCWGIK